MQKQVIDDPDLLRLMLDNSKSVPDIYKTTNYWETGKDVFITELITAGLKNFRRRRNSRLSGFGATDLSPEWMIDFRYYAPIFSNRMINKFPFRLTLLNQFNPLFKKMIKLCPPYYRYIKNTPYLTAKREGKKAGARSVDAFGASVVGNPEDIITANGRVYTTSILYYYLRYAYCCRFIDFDKINILVELGSGCGKQVEVIKKLHPHISFLIFEIPPQLYVCEQYLTALFPESVVSYRQTRDMTVPTIEKGKIYIFGNWKFPLIENIHVDLFWNAASFQEMEPEVVSNYLKFVNTQSKYSYLFEKMDGKELASENQGRGVLYKTTIKNYIDYLSDFRLVDLSAPVTPERKLMANPFTGKRRKTTKQSEYPSVGIQKAISTSNYRDSFWIHA